MTTLEIPELSVVALIGASGAGKSTFARAHFAPTEVLSSDVFRGLVSDDETDQSVSGAAFDALYYLAAKRLELGRLTVIDATNVQRDARAGVLRLAKDHDCLAVAIVLNIPEAVCRQRNEGRPERRFGPHVIANQARGLRQSIKSLRREGFRYVYVLDESDVADCQITRTPLWNNRLDESGPFDIIGDVHGCYRELCQLLSQLGYSVDADHHTAEPPAGRRAVFVGDLVDRGPGSVDVLRLVMAMVATGAAYCVPGNHEVKLLKKLRGRDVQLTHGLDLTVAQLAEQPAEFSQAVATFIDSLVSHLVFDHGALVVAHAGLIEKYQGRASGRVREFCLYGDTTGETEEYGLPVRLPWANDYRGRALVVYGHTPVVEPAQINHTICIDTGCVFGGKLTAYRYPEGEFVAVPGERQYAAPIRPLFDQPPPDDDLLTIDDVSGRQHITTRLRPAITIQADNAAAALEVMSRFAADPHWLIYLPPTMSPCETSTLPDYLEYPTQAFDYYRTRGVGRVVCQRKHMGSRAVIVVCRDGDVAARRFGVTDGGAGIIYTRTGRHFFEDPATEQALLARLRAALDASGFWRDFATDWVCLDTELMPWSAKARQLLIDQYAPVGRAGGESLAAAIDAIERAIATAGDAGLNPTVGGVDLAALRATHVARAEALAAYRQAYARYCWDVASLDDYRIAPFHLLATEGRIHTDQNHLWHLDQVARYVCATDPVFMTTDHLVVDLSDEASVGQAIAWWRDLTESGGEGMVVKPYDFIATAGADLTQPAVKCRGREYLRIIYGPEYLLNDNLERLKRRSLTRKRNLALSEFALGVESLERFVRGEPLYRVHQGVFAVLALESEPVDPRL